MLSPRSLEASNADLGVSVDALAAPAEDEGERLHDTFSIGGLFIDIFGHRQADIKLPPPWVLFRSKGGTPDLRIDVERVPSLSSSSERHVFDSGSVWRLYSNRGEGFRFDFSSPALTDSPYKRLFVNARFSRATLQLSEEWLAIRGYEVPPLEYPLDELLIMHRLTQESAIELHGCGIVGADGTGNLFVGHSGAGKSTTARLWAAREGIEILSDDRIIVRRDEGGSAVEMPCESAGAVQGKGILRLRTNFASRSSCSAQDDNVERASVQDDKAEKQIPRFARNDKPRYKIRMYGTPWHGEAQFASPANAPLTRICILEHGYGNVLTRLSPGQAVAELFARSFVPFHRHEYLESALAFLEDVAGSIPCYRYFFEPDERAVDTILNFHD